MTGTRRYFIKCPACKTPRTIDSTIQYFTQAAANGEALGSPNTWVRCNCGRILQHWTGLNARHSDKVACDARCTGATKAECECSCDGKNHGADHMAVLV